MLKRINWKAILKTFVWAICLSGLVVLMSFIAIKKQTVKCTDVKILIPGANNFIEREEIDAILMQSQGKLIGRNLEQINIHLIEKSLKANPYIAFAKVYADMDGIISIEIKQRQPILRVINAANQDYYIDSDGLKMPISANFTANVLVATGNILEHFGGKIDTLLTPLASDLYKTALFIKADTLWDAQIEQIFVNANADIELIPRVGNQRIILGNADSLQTKMNNLLAFYKQAMPKVGWDTYSAINIKYVNQIIGVKRDSLSLKLLKTKLVLDSTQTIQNAIDSAVNDVIAKEIVATPVTAVKKTEAIPAVKTTTATPVKTTIVKTTLPTAKETTNKTSAVDVKPPAEKVILPVAKEKAKTDKSIPAVTPKSTTEKTLIKTSATPEKQSGTYGTKETLPPEKDKKTAEKPIIKPNTPKPAATKTTTAISKEKQTAEKTNKN